ncbi:MAG: DVU_1551 family NTP transferase [Thermodesulfobacteriota bacterium]
MDRRGITAVVLAAGNSSRMGRFKPLLPIGGVTMVERTVALFRKAGIEDICVVTGHGREQLAPLFETAAVRNIVNRRDHLEMFSSVRLALDAMEPETEAVILLPADIPLIRPWTVRFLLESHHRDRDRILIPCFRGKRGHPVIIPREYFDTIRSWCGKEGLKGVLDRLAPGTVPVAVADENILFDIDTPADYEAALERWERFAVPNRNECEAILRDVVRVTEAVYRHCQTVAAVAERICAVLSRAGWRMDSNLIVSAALLHDLAKGCPHHEKRAAELLMDMGFPETARIVASHTDIECSGEARPTCAEVLYLADKLVKGDRSVNLEDRFEAAMKRYGADPWIRGRIWKRMQDAHRIREKIEAATGSSLPLN